MHLQIEPDHSARNRPPHLFATTHWSVVLSAGNSASPEATDALGKLYLQYWYPLYAYVRRRGYDPHQSEDLVSEFFARLLEKSILTGVVRDRGKFRAFLLTAVNHFLHDEWDRVKTQKRGGGHTFIPLPSGDAEQRYEGEMIHSLSPEKLYQRRWLTTLLDHILRRLEAECQAEGPPNHFSTLRMYLQGESGVPAYAETAAQLGLTEGAVRVAVHRLRKRYGDLFREELLQTVASPRDLQDEIRSLFAVFAD